MAVSISSPPSYWVHKSSQAEPKHFLQDAPGTKASVCDIIKSTWKSDKVGVGRDAAKLKHVGIKIIEVKRIENPALFRIYNEQRKAFVLRGLPCPPVENIPEKLANFNKKTRRPDVNEYYLFHGTQECRIDSIAAKGFETRRSDSGNLYGKAVYFTGSFQKADQYSDKPDNRMPPGKELTVIMARVLLGHTYKCEKADAVDLKDLQYIQSRETATGEQQQRYDSVESTDLLFKEFAVDGPHCYPEYIIRYVREGRQNIPTQNEVSENRRKKKKQPRSKPKRNKQAITWQEAVQSITATLDGRALITGPTKLAAFWQQTKTASPVYEFKENTSSEENRWKYTCTIHFPIEATTVASGRRKRIAKRLAAEIMWQKLKSLLETNPTLVALNFSS